MTRMASPRHVHHMCIQFAHTKPADYLGLNSINPPQSSLTSRRIPTRPPWLTAVPVRTRDGSAARISAAAVPKRRLRCGAPGRRWAPRQLGPRAPEAATPGNGDIAVSAQRTPDSGPLKGASQALWRLPGAPFSERTNEKGTQCARHCQNPASAKLWRLRLCGVRAAPAILRSPHPVAQTAHAARRARASGAGPAIAAACHRPARNRRSRRSAGSSTWPAPRRGSPG